MNGSRLPSARAMIGDWTLDRYQRLLTPQLIVSPIVFLMPILSAPNWATILIEVIWFVLIGRIVSRRRGGRIETITAGAVAGFLTGIAVSLGRWVADPSATWGANVVSESLVTMLIGGLLAAASHIVDRRLHV